ncbi:MAG: hypothetical protein L3J86_01155, partial [Thermoplasmata archaeon]|nr:hypothetical protein [Thermoplasmata archaeon]
SSDETIATESPGGVTHVDLSWQTTLTRNEVPSFVAARDALLDRFEGRGSGEPDAWLPSPLVEALRGIPHPEAPVIALDSWEGFVDRYLDLAGGPAGGLVRPGRIERLLLSLLLGRGARVILVSEREASDALDYIADSVLVTATAEFEDRLVRIFSISKLRGFAIEETVYPYTLADGRFTFVPRLPPNPLFLAVGSDPDPTPKHAEGLWPGSQSFADAFGRLALGGLSVFEIDPTVSMEVPRLITGAAVITNLALGGRVLLALNADIPVEPLYHAMRTNYSEEQLYRQIRFLSPSANPGMPERIRNLLIPLDVRSEGSGFVAVTDDRARYVEPLFPESSRFLQEPMANGAPGLAVLPVDALQTAARTIGLQYTPDALAAILHQDVAGFAAHAMIIGRTGDPILDPLRVSGLPYIRVLERQGRVFMFGQRPWTSAFILQPTPNPQLGRPYDLFRMS